MLDVSRLDLHVVTMSASEDIETGQYQLDLRGETLHVTASGSWNYAAVKGINAALVAELEPLDYSDVKFDLSGVTTFDTFGSFILSQAIRCNTGQCSNWSVSGGHAGQKALIGEAVAAAMGRPPPMRRPWYDALSRLGEATMRGMAEIFDTIAFFGRVLFSLFRVLLVPQRVRWKSVTALIEEVGLDALPIVMILSFFIGCVIAFMGAQLLAAFGVQIFMVDLVGLAVLREFAVLIMAIMMAARSNSAFTASIGSMKMRQEIDAMTVIGLNTDETLVAPRALACLVSAPILTFAAMVSGLIGGAVVARFVENISFNAFFVRIANEIPIDHFWVGMSKAPFFALVIAMIGCRQGLAVEGSVDSLGQRTTASVVQAIFSVIVIDAIFAMFYLEIGY